MRSESGLYIARLDHLRFFAASLIVLFHTFHRTIPLDIHTANPLLLLVDEGHTAVSLFLVISGFIFATLARGSGVRYGPFIYNRLVRIYPLLIFAVMLGASAQRGEVNVLQLFFDYLTPLSSFNTTGTPLTHFGHLWTVAIEMQVYLLFPFMHRFRREYGDRYLWGLVTLLIVLRALVWSAFSTAQTIGYWTIFGRLDQFIIGMLLAEYVARNPARLRHPAWLVLALSLMYGVMLGLDRMGGFYGGGGFPSPSAIWILRPTIEAVVWGGVVVTYLGCAWSLGRHVSFVLDKLGEASYSIYVVHVLVLWALLPYIEPIELSGHSLWSGLLRGVVFVLPATCLLSLATYRLIERPFLRMRKHYLVAGPPPTA